MPLWTPEYGQPDYVAIGWVNEDHLTEMDNPYLRRTALIGSNGRQLNHTSARSHEHRGIVSEFERDRVLCVAAERVQVPRTA